MKDTSNLKPPKRYEIWINKGHKNDQRPENSTMELELKGPFPLTDGEFTDIAQDEHKEFIPGNSITVNSGDKITWKVIPGDIDSILILHKEKGKNVFASGPVPTNSGKDWSGTIKIVGTPEDEEYAICWSQGGKTYCFDPKITVNP